MRVEKRYLTGAELYGDNLTGPELAKWYAEEEQGYYDLANNHYGVSAGDDYRYEYHALNAFHAYDKIKGTFECCVALGCAKGDDVLPLADRVGRFVAIEPAEQWWSSAIGGVPTTYLKPVMDGTIPLPDRSADIVVALGVLHHVAPVSKVLSEIARILKPGGVLIMREPLSSMGDWTRSRPGLTKNERGLPVSWVRQALSREFTIETLNLCMFPGTYKISKNAFNRRLIVALDYLLSESLAWNSRYWRSRLMDKFAPTSAFYVARRRRA